MTVAGAARSGIAAAELLARRGARVTLSETRAEAPERRAAARAGRRRSSSAGTRTETFTGADLVVLSPGVPPEQPAVQAARERGVPVIAEIELASRWLQGRVIAITGTKGKSTTTALTGRMLEAAGFKVTVGGNIGAPLSAQVSMSTPDTLHVVETSSFQLEQIDTFHPWIAVMLNFSPDHLDRHPTVDAYARGEGADLREPGRGRLGGDQRRRSGGARAGAPRPRDRGACSRARRRSPRARWSRTAGSSIGGRTSTARLVPLEAIHLLGPHLVDDVMAAATVGAIAGCGAGGDDGGGRRVPRPRARDGARRARSAASGSSTTRRRPTSSRRCDRSRASSADLVPIIGGRFKGGDLRLLREPLARAREGRRGDRRSRGRWCARRSADVVDGARGRRRSPTRSRARTRWRSRQAWCCSRRRARASTCSATTRSGDALQGGGRATDATAKLRSLAQPSAISLQRRER